MLSKRARAEDTTHWSESSRKRRRDDFAAAAIAELNSPEEEEWHSGIEVGLRDRINEETVDSDIAPATPVREVPPPIWLVNPPMPEGWTVDPAVRLAKLTKTVPGTHVWCRYEFSFMHIQSPLPKTGSRSIVPKLHILERGSRPRPSHSRDSTLEDYLRRSPNTDEWVDVLSTIPAHPSKCVYHIEGCWVLYDYQRFPSCANCGKTMATLNGRTTTTIDNFRFRACCYPAPRFRNILPRATVAIDECVPVFYDLETTPDDSGVHEFYMGIMSMPKLAQEDLGLQPYVRVNDADRFMSYVDSLICLYRDTRDGVRRSLQLVSFNGSRYDDLFLQQAWRQYIYRTYGMRTLKKIEYSERQGAMTFNTLRVSEFLEVKWTDLARFVPPTSLKNLAKSFKLSVEKGSMPFNALNDFVQKGADAVVRGPDGFLDLETYYRGDEKERARSLEYYQSVVPPDVRNDHSRDIDYLCERYCTQDVEVTEKAYYKLEEMYSTYLREQASLSPHASGPEEPEAFQPMCLHSMSTLAGKVMMASAAGSTVWGFDTDLMVSSQITPGTDEGWEISVPRDSTYDYLRQAIVGGWVKNYVQGLIVDDEHCTKEMLSDIDTICAKEDLRTLRQTPHDMTDIASMYPVGMTYPMPVGAAEWVEDPDRRLAIFHHLLSESDPILIPKFFARCKLVAPTRPQFAESTLPQRKETSNSLRWTYWDDMSGTRTYTSLDLWIACRDHLSAGVGSAWTVTEFVDMLYFPRSAQIYRPFMESCAKMKMDGAAEGNLLKRTCGKIAMNAAIGKTGQRVDAQHNIIGADAAMSFAERGGDNVRLVGTSNLHLNGEGRRAPVDDTEYIFGLKDASKNMWPLQHAAFMYAATRLMRLNWSILTRPEAEQKLSLLEVSMPDTFYGDTDSKILSTSHSALLPKEMIGNIVGQFQPEHKCSMLTRPFFQVELEDVCAGDFHAAVSGILTSKKYFVWGVDSQGNQRLKFKCNGLVKWDEDRHPCALHTQMHCIQCKCSHGLFVFSCLPCIFHCLKSESFEKEGESYIVQGKFQGQVYKYRLDSLPALSLLDFVRVLSSGLSCKTVKSTFERALSLGTSKLPPFTVQTKDQSRSLNRPALLCTLKQVASDTPLAKLTSFVSGCAQPNVFSPVLLPSGSYLLKSNVLPL